MHRPGDQLAACIAHTGGLDQQIVEWIELDIASSDCLLLRWVCRETWSERIVVRWMELGGQPGHN